MPVFPINQTIVNSMLLISWDYRFDYLRISDIFIVLVSGIVHGERVFLNVVTSAMLQRF